MKNKLIEIHLILSLALSLVVGVCIYKKINYFQFLKFITQPVLISNNVTRLVPQSSLSLKTSEKKLKITAWGDSMTKGVNGDGISYPSVLQKLTGIETYNFGIGGETSLEIMSRSLRYGDQSDSVIIIEMGDNGGWNKDIDVLIAQYKKIIKNAKTDQYIIISSTDDPNDFDQIWGYTHEKLGLENTWYEEKLEQAFGSHLLKARQYIIKNGLRINGLNANTLDLQRAEAGYISTQLRKVEIDNTHLNSAGYIAQGYGVFELGRNLGYW